MRNLKRLTVNLVCVISGIFLLVSCNDASVASENLSKAADQFEIYRRVVFYNGITDNYILSVEGYCSIKHANGQLEVLVKTKDGKFMKHHLGLSDNVTYFSEQLNSKNVSSDRYRVIFKPKSLIPTLEIDK